MNRYVKILLKLGAAGLLAVLLTMLGSHIYVQGLVDGQYIACEASLAINAKTGPYELYCAQENNITYVRSKVIDVQIEISSPNDLHRLQYREQ